MPRSDVMLGRTLGGATVATIQGTIVLIISIFFGFRPGKLAYDHSSDIHNVFDLSYLLVIRYHHRIIPRRYAGLFAHHQFHRHADVLFVGGTISSSGITSMAFLRFPASIL